MQNDLIPASIAEFYVYDSGMGCDGMSYGEMRQRDCDIAEASEKWEKVRLNKLKSMDSGRNDVLSLQYNWFWNEIGKPHDLSYVASPDARVPNYTIAEWKYYKYREEIENYRRLHAG